MSHREDFNTLAHEKHFGWIQVVSEAMARFNYTHLVLVDTLIDPDEEGAWVTDGSLPLSEWLTARYRMGRFTAHTLSRMVERLPDCPNIRRTFEEDEGGSSLFR